MSSGKEIIIVMLTKYPADWRPRNCPADELSGILGKCNDPGPRAWECVLILKASLGGKPAALRGGGEGDGVMECRQEGSYKCKKK